MNPQRKTSGSGDNTRVILTAAAAILLATAFWQGRDLPVAGLCAPYAVFSLAAAFYQPGASLRAVVGFLCAWSLWSLSRLPVEMALGDPKAALVRYRITFVVPPLAGLLASAATWLV